jgi:hypothetical protein
MATNAGPVLQRDGFDGHVDNLYWRGGGGTKRAEWVNGREEEAEGSWRDQLYDIRYGRAE